MNDTLPKLVDVSGVGDAGPVRWKMVRLIEDDDGWQVYGEHRRINGTPVEGADGIVHAGTLPPGELVADPVKRQRWTMGGYRITEHRGCGCTGRGSQLKAWTP